VRRNESGVVLRIFASRASVSQRAGQLPALGVELEVDRVLVLDEGHRHAGRAGTFGERVDALHHGLGLVGARRIVAKATLDIDHEDGSFHGRVRGNEEERR
jgi:hypothetical protein